jgi:hypothetical protein
MENFCENYAILIQNLLTLSQKLLKIREIFIELKLQNYLRNWKKKKF